MTDAIIRAENVSKHFIISHQQREKYTSLRDVLAGKAGRLFSLRSNSRSGPISKEEFWALKDINFEIKQGDRVGIIGRNGAGKSTLLKILSRITEPTSGRVIMRGRVASLLEVGTGFHQELTGRENIFLNGAILGMSRAEIKSKFDEIVAFAEVEKFLDTPVKRYSSGMYVRLAFAIAAHLEPEILIVDEVLAVGDTQFQRKCMGKMEDVSKREGRTVLFVSHDLNAVNKLCNSAIMLEKGKLFKNDTVENVIDAYLSLSLMPGSASQSSRTGTSEISLISLKFKNSDQAEIQNLTAGAALYIEMTCEAKADMKNVQFAICFNDMYNTRITSIWSAFKGKSFDITRGVFKVEFKIDSLGLIPGNYQVISYINLGEITVERIDNLRMVNVIFNEKKIDCTIPSVSQGFYVEQFETSVQALKK
ncbi:MAG: ABC transporter ATP-binding protein [Bacteroidetes bacterium]|nr:ABC transporter ATP-binding protein [Bacteroidota bacterium]